MFKFPQDFIWGTATASYQIEGAAKEDGKGLSIWDTFSHTPGKVYNDDNGDIACDHYHRYKEDIQIMKNIGLKGYRFSISWSRIFPEGKKQINQKGIDFYNILIDELLKNGIEPAITLYHWDLPQTLQDIGGWENRETINYFIEYAKCAFNKFGDRVKKWITHNEPSIIAFGGNYDGYHPPGYKDLSLAVKISHHLLLSHAKVVELYKQINKQKGKIGIALNLYPIYPATDSENDKDAVLFANDYYNTWFLDPVLKGKYPEKLFNIFKEKFNSPVILSNDIDILKRNRCDFLGINYYMRKIVKDSNSHKILKFEEIRAKNANFTYMDWEIFPKGIYDILIYIKEEYDNPEIYITENGAAFNDTVNNGDIINDNNRIDFLKEHFKEANKALNEGVHLCGYYIWSLMDNFEWAYGYSKRFGLIYVDYQSLKRIWKKSAYWYKDIIKNNGLI
jgi:beta-glucosidase